MQIQLVAVDGETDVEILNDWSELKLTVPLNDTPVLEFKMPGLTLNGDKVVMGRSGRWLLSSEVDVSLRVAFGDGKFTEPPGCRFVVVTDDGDHVKDNAVSITALGVDFDTTGMIPTETKLFKNDDGRWKFPAKSTPGQIIGQYFDKAKAAGAGIMLSRDFTHGVDSAGKAWKMTLPIEFAPTVTLRMVLDSLSDQGLIDWRFEGNKLRVFNADTAMRRDAGVELVPGRDVTSFPQERSIKDMAHTAVVWGEKSMRTVVEVPTKRKRGRRIVSNSQGGISKEATARVLANSMLEERKSTREEITCNMSIHSAETLPFRDFGVGDLVWGPEYDGTLSSLRVFAITLVCRDGRTISGAITLGDRFLEAAARQARKVQGIVGGSTVSGGTHATPAAPPPTQTPAPPTGITTESHAYTPDGMWTMGVVTIQWINPTMDVEGTPLYYSVEQARVEGRLVGASRWESWGSGWVDQATKDGLQPGKTYEFRISVFSGSRWSAWTTPKRFIAGNDSDPPQRPSDPKLESELGVIIATWDGKDYSGSKDWPTDFSHIVVSVNDEVHGVVYKAGDKAVITGHARGESVPITFTAYDFTGNASLPSVATTKVIGILDSTDLKERLKEADQSVVALRTEILPQITQANEGADDAKRKAEDAARAAGDAKREAEDALRDAAAAAGLATDKADLWVGSETPPAKYRNGGALWVDLSSNIVRVWDSGWWRVVQDRDAIAAAEAAAEAQGLAKEAQFRAENAEQDAEAAMRRAEEAKRLAITANGRVTVGVGSPPQGTSQTPMGAIYWEYAQGESGDELTRMWKWDGKSWINSPLSREIIPLIDIGSGTFGDLSGARITANTIATNALAIGAVTNAKLGDKAVSAVKIADGAVTAGKIYSKAVTTEKIDTGAITSDKLSVGALDYKDAKGISLTSSTITGGTITGSTFRTTAASNRGVTIDSNGITGYNSGGVRTFLYSASSGSVSLGPDNNIYLDGSTGDATLKGDFVSNNGQVPYLEIRRGIWRDATGIRWNYDGSAWGSAYISSNHVRWADWEPGAINITAAPARGKGERARHVQGFSPTYGASVHDFIGKGPAYPSPPPDTLDEVAYTRLSAGAHRFKNKYGHFLFIEMASGSTSRTISMANDWSLRYAGSLRKWKTDIRDYSGDPYAPLALRPITYRNKEDLTEVNFGLIAEEVEEAAVERPELLPLAQYLHDSLTGVAYDRLAVLLLPMLRDMNERLNKLEAK